jgi:hypothetical protein
MKLHIKDNYYTYIDREDYDRIVELLDDSNADPAKWQLTFNSTDRVRKYYASKTIGGRKGKKWKLHRLIFVLRDIDIEGKEIDHIDGDGLNNRFSNLRIATSSQNKANRPPKSGNKLGYKGVEKNTHGDKYTAYIVNSSKKKSLGSYSTAEEAALAYNRAAIELWGEYAWTNKVKKLKV